MRSFLDCPLFDGIGKDSMDVLFQCLDASCRFYDKDEFIFLAGEPAVSVGIVVSGGVIIVHEDFWGNRSILAHIGSGGLFGEAFSCAGIERLPVSAIASEKTEILLVDYKKIITTCNSPCEFHARLISNMIRVLAQKNIQLTRKLEHLSKKTTREKLLSFLSAQAVQTEKGEGTPVDLPFNRQELADYLGVDRSALSRELGKMKDEGLITFEKNRFILLKMAGEEI